MFVMPQRLRPWHADVRKEAINQLQKLLPDDVIKAEPQAQSH